MTGRVDKMEGGMITTTFEAGSDKYEKTLAILNAGTFATHWAQFLPACTSYLDAEGLEVARHWTTPSGKTGVTIYDPPMQWRGRTMKLNPILKT